ncbi:hypothetical protein QBC34DRAFT_399476 [Podospora aff. communis PSN243]|uniref:Uncharacterized protein n=1 Tax=Podospora aff. communis PSN243 TaxID=3040156 RepID=A0AAV9H027_9PEZI|nr:hypothetical protein QBC34DRAFT_399476 [Podospora aff. communis PSN243]
MRRWMPGSVYRTSHTSFAKDDAHFWQFPIRWWYSGVSSMHSSADMYMDAMLFEDNPTKWMLPNSSISSVSNAAMLSSFRCPSPTRIFNLQMVSSSKSTTRMDHVEMEACGRRLGLMPSLRSLACGGYWREILVAMQTILARRGTSTLSSCSSSRMTLAKWWRAFSRASVRARRLRGSMAEDGWSEEDGSWVAAGGVRREGGVGGRLKEANTF